MINIFNFIKDILAPKNCLKCNLEGAFICEKCFEKLSIKNPYCYVCKKKSPNFEVHDFCKKDDIFYDKIIVLAHYKGIFIKKLIKNGKFYGRKDILADFGKYMADYLLKYEILEKGKNNIQKMQKSNIQAKNISIYQKNEENLRDGQSFDSLYRKCVKKGKLDAFFEGKISGLENYDYLAQKLDNYIIIPTPMYFLKKIVRGYNQSEILAKRVSKNLQVEYSSKIIRKTRNTKQQSKLSKAEREKNLSNCFEINFKNINLLKDKTVILVDDVVSTGTTLNEVSRILKQNGVKKIVGIGIASD